jgi:methylenetetrahydrofolate reductase (NADPH)
MAITQLFFHADDYLRFVSDARDAGVTIPILPGLMPATSPARLERILELTGERRPERLSRGLAATDDPDAQRELGVDFTVDLAREILAGGAPSLHLYSFNQHEPVVSVLERLDLIPAIGRTAPEHRLTEKSKETA